MTKLFVVICVVILSSSCYGQTDKSASDLLADMYDSCLSRLSVSCVRPKALSWISEAVKNDRIKITDELSIIRNSNVNFENDNLSEQRNIKDDKYVIFDKLQGFLSTHSLRAEVPKLLQLKEARQYIPEAYLNGGLSEGMTIPLSDQSPAEGRGFVKKIMIPFLLGLKFKTTVMVPIALALIALKTWKAMTLGLLSIVLSGALVIFKLLKPKIVNYEVVHYPPHHHHIEHHIEHPPHHGWEAPGWGRQFDSQQMVYSGQL